MSILAVRITTARDHEAADRLRVYNVEAPTIEPTQIIANKDTIYEVGDIAAAALVGTVLADGTVMEKSKIRGVLSFGMLLGKVTDPLGTDLTARFGATHVEKKVDDSQGVVEESVWPRYTSIDGFLRVKDEILAVPEVIITEKAHGSNARFGYFGARPYVVGTHTSRVVDSRLRADTWPQGHLIRKTLEWGERVEMAARLAALRAAHPEITSIAVFGEICGFKCSDLHYGQTAESEVRLFGDVAVNGRFLDYDPAVALLQSLFPEAPIDTRMVPVLYRGAPDLAVFKRLRDQVSTLATWRGAQQISEGIVIRPSAERISSVTMNRLIAKYKSPLYEERASLRGADPDALPVYVSAYDLLADFVTEERVRHVLAKAEASGAKIEKRYLKQLAEALFADIQKESVGEWPADAAQLDTKTLVRWTFTLAGEMLTRVVEEYSQ